MLQVDKVRVGIMGWQSLTLGEIAAYMKEDPTFALHLWSNETISGAHEHLASIEFQKTGLSGGPLEAVGPVIADLVRREQP